MTPNSQLEKIAQNYSQLFTHCFAAFGSLRSKNYELLYEQLPENSTVFDLASLTKALVTAPLVVHAFDGLEKPLAELEPKLKDHFNERLLKLTPKQLLSHTSGLPAWQNFWINRFNSSGKLQEPSHEKTTKHIDLVLNRASL